MTKEKREQKTLWVPKPWLDYIKKVYEENKEILSKLNIHSHTDIIWQLAALGKDDLEELITHLKQKSRQKL